MVSEGAFQHKPSYDTDSLSLRSPHLCMRMSPPGRVSVPLPHAKTLPEGSNQGKAPHQQQLHRASFISKGWGECPSESRYQLEKGSAVAGDHWGLRALCNAAVFVPLFENKERDTGGVGLLMDLPARPDASSYEDKAPSGSRVVATITGVRCQLWEISCRSARRANRAGEEPARVSDGDVFSSVPPALVLQ